MDQLVIRDADGLARIDELDEARWAATSMPTDGLEVDPAFLAFLDDDHNGRVRVEEMKRARAWLWERLAGRTHLAEKTDTLLLADLDTKHEGARVLHALGVRLLTQLGAEPKDRITLGQVRSFEGAYKAKFPNGDGVVAPAQVTDAELAEFVKQVVAVTGGAPDLSGEVGFRVEDVDAWVARVRDLVAWRGRQADDAAELFPLGEATASAAARMAAIAPKVEQFFAQCALLALETGAEARLQATPEQLAALDVSDPAAIAAWMAKAPVARPHADGVLQLGKALNPAFAADVEGLVREVVGPLIGATEPLESVTAAQWTDAQARLAPYRDWAAGQPGGFAADADPAALLAVAEGPLPAAAKALAAQDREVADELVAFRDLEKLVLYHRGLLELANNLVSFAGLFDPEELAIFQDGVLILDGRRLDLCLRVTHKGEHKPIAETSLVFLAYCDLTRKDDAGASVTRSIVAAVTAGTRGGIGIGKRGVFYDRLGHEWDALVTDLVVQPISVWEAMISPFTRIRDTIASKVRGMIESKTAEAEASAQTHADTAATATTATVAAAPAAPPPAAAPAPAAGGGMGMQGMLIGGSVAFAALGSTLAFVAQTLSSIDPVSLLATLAGVVGLLAGLSALLGWLKLRRRDLSAILEAGGWALNGRMHMSTWLGGRFTERPPLPKGSEVRRVEPGNTLAWVVIVLVVLAVAVGLTFWKLPRIVPWMKGEADSPWPVEVVAPAEVAPAAAPAEVPAAEAAPAAP